MPAPSYRVPCFITFSTKAQFKISEVVYDILFMLRYLLRSLFICIYENPKEASYYQIL